MDKDDLNRRFGDPDRQKPITPTELLAAAHLIRDHCNNMNCHKCIFSVDRGINGCSLFEVWPSEWNLAEAECRTVEWLDKQYPFTNWHYIDTDTKE